MVSVRKIILAAILPLLVNTPLAADVLLLDSMHNTPAVQTPRSGMAMGAVRAGYGSPSVEHAPVSQAGGPQHPPITRWDYAGFPVFFEHDRVIHAVVHRGAN